MSTYVRFVSDMDVETYAHNGIEENEIVCWPRMEERD